MGENVKQADFAMRRRLARARLILDWRSVSRWAKRSGFDSALVNKVLSGTSPPLSIEAHEIAVRLGLHRAEDWPRDDLSDVARARAALAARGSTIARWAVANRLDPLLVTDVLKGGQLATWSQARTIAIKLGLQRTKDTRPKLTNENEWERRHSHWLSAEEGRRARAALLMQGTSVARWAAGNGFRVRSVANALCGKTRGRQGAAREIALRLRQLLDQTPINEIEPDHVLSHGLSVEEGRRARAALAMQGTSVARWAAGNGLPLGSVWHVLQGKGRGRRIVTLEIALRLRQLLANAQRATN